MLCLCDAIMAWHQTNYSFSVALNLWLNLSILLRLQVKVLSWIDGNKENEVVGISARFGKTMESHAHEAQIYSLAAANPITSCNLSSQEVAN